MPHSSDGAVFGAQAGEDWLNPNGIRSTFNDFDSFWYLYLCIQQFVVYLTQETKQKQNVMQLKDLTIGSVIKYTDIENPGAEYVVLGQAFESYINILCKETNNIEPMHAMTQMVGKRWEIVAKA